MSIFTIQANMTVRELDVVRRALRRHYDALQVVPDRRKGDPDPTALQLEKRTATDLLGRFGYIEPLPDEPPARHALDVTFPEAQLICSALDLLASKCREADDELPPPARTIGHNAALSCDAIIRRLRPDWFD